MDRHLNCFLSYNYDNELIENNLTRSFIVTLSGLSPETKNNLLTTLKSELSCYNFYDACFALQDNIEINPRVFKQHKIITISTDNIVCNKDVFSAIDKDVIKATLLTKNVPSGAPDILKKLCSGSIPDAWIFDGVKHEYCFLIECKKQGDFIYYPQIIRHAFEHYGIADIDEVDLCTINITWYDILGNLNELVKGKKFQNLQEQFILNQAIEYLGFFGYCEFKGFNFPELTSIPRPQHYLNITDKGKLFFFNKLDNPPDFKIKF
jgi:hypothetical protein